MSERAGLNTLILFKTYLGQSKTLFGCQVVQKPTEVIEISDSDSSGFLPFASPVLAIIAIGLAGIRKNEDLL